MKSHILWSTGSMLAVFVLSSCGGGSGGGSTGGTPSVPANATVIDATNATEVVQAVASTLTQLQTFASLKPEDAGVEAGVSSRGILPEYREFTRTLRAAGPNTALNIVTGVTFSDSGSCTGGGTYDFTWDEIDTPPTYSETGSETFVNCTEGSLTVNGNDSYSYFENSLTGEYSDSANGSITMTLLLGGDTLTIGFNSFNYAETGNDILGTYTVSSFSMSLAFSNSTASFGVAVGLDSPIVESNGDNCPESGTVRIQGGSGSVATGTFNGSTIEVTANGTPLGSVACT